MPEQLRPIAIGLGASRGYSGDDLTSARNAAVLGELDYATEGHGQDVLELRIHGVGGMQPEETLESPATLQVGGDRIAGFYRGWFPGGLGRAAREHREAYSWGKLNYGGASRALWLLLVPFMIVNVAHWALPARSGRRPDAVCRSLLRLLALAFTFAFTGTAVTVLVDMIAWQAPGRGALPSWLSSYGRLGVGPRMAIALLAVLAVLLVLIWLSLQTTRSYETWHAGDGAEHATDWALTSPTFWHGERAVDRQRICHIVAVCAQLLFVAVMPHGSVNALRWTLLVVAIAMSAAATVLVASPWTDRIRVAGMPVGRFDRLGRWAARLSVVLAFVVSVARFWWHPDDAARALPGAAPRQTGIVFVEFGLLIVFTAVLIARRPWRQPDVLAKGMAASLFALVGCVVGVIFGAAVTLTTANALGTPRVTECRSASGCGSSVLYVPSTVYAGGAAVLAMVAAMVIVAGWAGWSVIARRTRRETAEVEASYQVAATDQRSVGTVARIWAWSSLAECVAPVVAAVIVPTAVVSVADQSWLAIANRPGAHWLTTLSSFGGVLGVAGTAALLVTLRKALVDPRTRQRFGGLWDVGSFWPRACHPFAPPCYAERSVPELVIRLRRVVGDDVRGADDPALGQQDAERVDLGPDDPVEAHSPVLLSGYSQGTPIAVAAIAQLPKSVTDRVALLTLAAPLRRFYGRAFPAYFGPQQLAALRDRLSDGDQIRWRNLVRRSDYIGGWALHAPRSGAVDHEILDPPVLWPDGDPTPPPTHLHADWFPDPQTRTYADLLRAML